jgi:hypothetical protein
MRRKLTRSALGIAITAALTLALASPAMADFGISHFDGLISDQTGQAQTQAGSHPYQVTSTFTFNQQTDSNGGVTSDGGTPKDVFINLPGGLIGDPLTTPQCPTQQLLASTCPDSDAIGKISLTLGLGANIGPAQLTQPVYNMVPRPGVPGEYGFLLYGFTPVYITGGIRTGGDYGLTVAMTNISQTLNLLGATLTLWGVPADPSHDAERGNCLVNGTGTCPSTANSRPFLTLPTSCPGPLPATLRTDSWQNPGDFKTASVLNHNTAGVPVGATGCGNLDFSPSLTVLPDNLTANTPDGLSFDLHLPQNGVPNQLVEAQLKKVALQLPRGLALSPSGFNGLQGCSQAQFGYTDPSLPSCPDASKIGIVEVDTPLFTTPMQGWAYLAQPTANPFGAPLVLYGYALGPTGVLEKFAGPIGVDPVTGQVTLLIDNAPQLPFSDFKLHFFGGAHGLLVNPPTCGLFGVGAHVDSWAGVNPATVLSGFPITSGCSSSPPFAPSFSAGTTNNQAGASTPFTMTLARTDQDQNLGALSVQTPPGLLGLPGPVPLCPEPQASQGSCDQSSLIGHATLASGVGPSPLYTGGQVFLTGPYKGAPFGMSIVVPLQGGALNLGVVVVRAAVSVDPHTTSLTITTDPLPQIFSGIPLQLKLLNLTLDQANVMLNPTNCSPLSINATASGVQGATAALSTRFQAANCASLPFSPKVAASIGVSRQSAATLRTDVLNAKGSANLAAMKVTLPKQLAPRTTTLHKACPQPTFDANPAACAAASVVGQGTVSTPVLPVPISGPAYVVARGKNAVDLDLVLQGYGVKLVLTGSLAVKKSGSTVTFAALPDVPTPAFELNLSKTGSGSLLAAVANICTTNTKSVVASAALGGQNGAQLKGSIKPRVTGCAKPGKSRGRPKAAKPKGKKASSRAKRK